MKKEGARGIWSVKGGGSDLIRLGHGSSMSSYPGFGILPPLRKLTSMSFDLSLPKFVIN